jgi:hypothetical protein
MTDLSSPPTIQPTEEWLARRRTHLVRALETAPPARRGVQPSWRVAAIALTVLLLAGAAVAATGYTFFDWLHAANPGEARFSIDGTRTVSWPAPEQLACDNAGEGEFSCEAGTNGRRVYESYGRVEKEFEVTRERVMAGLAEAEQQGLVSHARADEVRALIAAVEDEFFAKLNVLTSLSTVASPRQVRPGVYRIPPKGVPQIVTCRPEGSAYSCRDLAASTGVPVGAPTYGLRESKDWVETTQASSATRFDELVESIFGRPLTRAEEQLLRVFTTPAAGAGTGGASESETVPGG